MGAALRLALICLVFSLTTDLLAFSQVRLTHISTEDGLNQSNITGLMQDKDGYLWISSWQGINRYDGYRVSQVHSPDNILLNNYVESIFEDSMGLFWLGAAPNHNFILDKKLNKLTEIKFTSPPGYKLEFPMINRVVEDQGQNLWIATYLELFYFHRNENRFEFILELNQLFDNKDQVHSIRELLHVNGKLLIATSAGLYCHDISSRQTIKIQHLPEASTVEDLNNVKALLRNQSGKILVGTVEGLFELDQQIFSSEQLDKQPLSRRLVERLNIWSIIEEPEFYWLATDKGLYKLSKQDHNLSFVFKFSDTPFNTGDDDIVRMLKDKEGSLWFGTRGDGIFKWKPNPAIKAHYWNSSSSLSRLSSNSVNAIYQSQQDEVWVGTQNGLNLINPITKQVEHFLVNPDEKAVVSESSIYSIASRNDELWLNTEGGLKVFDRKTKKMVNRLFPKTDGDVLNKPFFGVRFFEKDKLALTNREGMYLYDLAENTISLVESTRTNGEIGPALGAIFETATGDPNSYFISGVDRLVKFSKETGEVIDFHKLPPSENFRSQPSDVYRDNDKLWVTYAGYGVYVLDANSGKELHFMSEKDLGSNTIMDIFPDSFGNLWFSTNEGLLRVNKTNYSSRLYDSNDGFATSEFNGGSMLRKANGDVFVGSVKGAFEFSPNELVNRSQRKIANRITSASLLSKPIEQKYGDHNDRKIVMEHNDFGLKIEFSALLLDKPKQVKYRYWIDGDAATDSTTIDRSELFLPTLEEGISTLNISAIDYETGLESKPARITIVSKSHPLLSNLAYSIYIITTLFLAWFNFHGYQKRAAAKKLAHEKLQQSEERLSLALKGGNSGLWDWHARDNLIYEPRLIENSTSKEDKVAFEKRISEIHPDDQEKYLAAWATFMVQDKKVFDVVYRMKNNSDVWAWYRDMATVSEYDENNKPVRITGTFTNITERKEARDKMRLFSTAFENTRDIVFVLNSEKEVIAANQAFYKTTEFEQNVILSSGMNFITDANANRKLIAEIFKHIYLQGDWEGEGLLNRNFKPPLNVLINATTFDDNEGKEHFVFALTDISKQKAAEGELRKLANYDTLTGLPNRALLLDRITHAIEHCRRRNQQLALFFIDLDRFKQINDTLGHDVGDLLLINVAKILQKSIRHDDTVARLGGDEFVVMLEDITSIDSINRIAQNIINKMQDPMVLKEHQVSVSPSIGVSIYPTDGGEAQTLIKHADIAMYHAKNAGRNNFQYFENSMNHAAKARLSLENKLRAGVSNHEFYLVYQPQYDVSSGRLIGMEALARWKTSDGELIPPSEFIPIAEDLGLIIPITEELLSIALEQVTKWQQQGHHIGLAFNLSARHLHHYDFVSFIESLLDSVSFQPEMLEFELTESVLMKDIDVAKRIFGRLAEKGIELALDDFGTGYSSLKYLNQLPINKLKIDRSFVSKIGTSSENDAIIKTITSLAHSLNLKTVAEGIETEEQLKFMQEVAADQAQGYYFSKPLSAEDFEKLLK